MGGPARQFGKDDVTAFRAVVKRRKFDGGEYVTLFGPYSSAPPAKAMVTRYKSYYPGFIDGWVERAPTNWERI